MTLGDQISIHSSNKLSDQQSHFKERLEDNLKYLMNKEADKFLFLSEPYGSNNGLSTPNFSNEKMNSSSFQAYTTEDFSSNDVRFNQRFTETCKKFLLDPDDLNSMKKPTNHKEKEGQDFKNTVKKQYFFDNEIERKEISEGNLQGEKKKNVEQLNKSEKNEVIERRRDVLRFQIDKFNNYLENYSHKHPEKFKKTFVHIGKLLYKIDENGVFNDSPEKMRENLEKITSENDILGHFNADINMDSNTSSAASEMKSNLSHFYESLKKNHLLLESKMNEENDLFVKYYNDGLNVIEETTENFVSKTTNTNNFQSKSVQKELKEENKSKSSALMRYILAKAGDKKSVPFKEIVKKCEKSMKIQTFLEILKMNSFEKVDLSQDNHLSFGDIIINIC